MRKAPGPRGHALFGSYSDLQRDALGFFVKCSREHGHVVRFKPFPGNWWHFISHPDDLDHLLQRHHANYPKGIFARLNSLAGGDGVLAAEGSRWVRQRKLMQPAFHGSRMPGMAAVVTSATDAMLDAWDSRPQRARAVDLSHELMLLTLGIAGRVFCGADIGGAGPAFGEAFRETLAYLDYRLVHPFALPLAVPTPRNLRYRRAVARLNAIVGAVIDERRRESRDAGDVLSALLAVRDEDGAPIDNRAIREEVRTQLAAGHETTSAALFWSLYEIARAPEQEAKLHAELDALGRPPTDADIARLPFTRMIIEESLRLYPPIVWLGRVAVEDDEIRGFRIPAGSCVVFSMYVTQRHPDFWENPDRFEPGRFAPESAPARPRSAYLPFGLGPRRCIGERFAMMEAILILARVGRRFRLRLVCDEPVLPEVLATLRPRPGAMMRLEPR